jgi:hypothetical protein
VDDTQTIARSPKEFTPAEIDDFVAFVLAGGEVAKGGLRKLVEGAKCIGFMRRGGCLLGVAGLKRPRPSYRQGVWKKSRIPLPTGALPFELGWVFILPSARGKGLSLRLCQPVVAEAGTSGIFATTRIGNEGMQSTLGKLGFKRTGSEWASKHNEENLVLYIKPGVA